MNDSDRVPCMELIRRVFSGELGRTEIPGSHEEAVRARRAYARHQRERAEDRREKAAEDFVRQAPEPWLK